MKPLALDLRGAKKISSDKHSSTMMLKNGHKLTVMHKALPALQRKQIERLPMADGGDVDHPTTYANIPLKSDVNNQELNSVTTAPMVKAPKQNYADGGEVNEAVDNYANYLGQHPESATAKPPSGVEVYKSGFKGDPDSESDYIVQPEGTGEPKRIRMKVESPYMNAAHGGKIQHYADGTADAEESDDVPTEEEKEASAKKLGISKEDMDAMAKMPVNPDPSVPSAPFNPINPDAYMQPNLPAAPNASITSPNDPYGSQSALQAQINALNEQRQGMLQQNTAESLAAHRQAGIEQEYQGQQQDLMKNYQSALAPLQKEAATIAGDVASGHIDPDRYINTMKTGTKIARGIGLVLGGLGAGLTHGQDYAFQNLQQNIQDDIHAQALDLGRKESLLNSNLARTGNLNTATQLTALQTNAIFASKFRQNAQYATNAQEAAKNLQIAGQFDGKVADIQHQMALQKALLGPAANQSDEQAFQNRMQYLRINGQDKQATEMEQKHLPGVPGQASRTIMPAEKTQWENLVNLQKNYNDAQDFLDKVGGAGAGYLRLDPGMAARGKSIQSAMTLEMGKLADLQRFTPEEKKLYLERVPDLTGTHITSQDANKLAQLQKELQDHKGTLLSTLGLPVQQSQNAPAATGPNAALNWAKANPNDPRSAKILQKLGK